MKVEVMLSMLVLVTVALAVASPKYRAQSLLAGGMIIVAIVMIVVLTKRGETPIATLPPLAAQAPTQQPIHVDFERFHIENLDKQDAEAKNRIAPTEIRFEQIRQEVGPQPGTIRSIGARLYNDSARFTLNDYAYYLVVQDCVKGDCTVIYDQRGWAPASVPAHQARDIIIGIRDGDARGVPVFKITGTANIQVSPTDARSYATP